MRKEKFAVVLRTLESPQFKGEPLGSFAVINMVTGEYVLGATLMDANRRFEQRFPAVPGSCVASANSLFSTNKRC